jgi:hypothetical protein
MYSLGIRPVMWEMRLAEADIWWCRGTLLSLSELSAEGGIPRFGAIRNRWKK